MIPGLSQIVRRALSEDVGSGDVSTLAAVPPESVGVAVLRFKAHGVLCGLPVASEVFRQVDPSVALEAHNAEGERLRPGEVVATVSGPLRSLLTAERTALNFVQRLSGVASQTRRYVDALGGAPVRLVDTRKTTPGIRAVEKYAVRVGGGHNHRSGLYDGVMLKDNHIAAAGSITEAVSRARERVHHLLAIEVEVETLAQANEAVDAGARVLLLDNFAVPDLATVVAELRKRPEELILEASGGITEETLAAVAATGVDVISSGALIHQAVWLDVSMDVRPADA